MDHATDIAVLKQRADQADARMGRVEDKLDRIIEALGAKATRQDVWTALATGAAIAFGVLAIMIAILTYLQDQRIAARKVLELGHLSYPLSAASAPPEKTSIDVVQTAQASILQF